MKPAIAVAKPPLSLRLQALLDSLQYSDTLYQDIWDCCCDHGYLGMAILQQGLCEHMYLVDKVPHIMTALSTKMQGFDAASFTLLTADAADLQLLGNRRHCVIVAGVGGQTTMDILQTICQKHSGQEIDFLICPTTGIEDLRDYLMDANFILLAEQLLQEQGKFYEIMLLRSNSQAENASPLSLCGSFTGVDGPIFASYLQQRIEHMQRRVLGDTRARSMQRLDEYQAQMKSVQQWSS
jgi:tRNA (adenine22-N1)-methyltransferase